MKLLLSFFILMNMAYALNFPKLPSNFKAKYKKIETEKKMKSISFGELVFQNGSSLILKEIKPRMYTITVSKEKTVQNLNVVISILVNEYLSALHEILLYISKRDEVGLQKLYSVKQSGSFFTLKPHKEMKSNIKKIQLRFGRSKSKIIVKKDDENELTFIISDYK